MKRKLILVIGCIAAAAMLASCAQIKYGQVEADWGTAQKLATFNQVLNPQAGKNLAPVEGIPGPVSQTIVRKYRSSFQKTTTASVYTFNFGR